MCKQKLNVIKDSPPGSQQDTQEYLMQLLNELNVEDLTSYNQEKTNDEINEILIDFDRERSLFEKIGSLKCQLKIKCKSTHISTNYQYDSMLILKFENYG
jgi:hypothetical protein